MPIFLKKMRKLFILTILGIFGAFSVKSQEIIPFPDLSQNHTVGFNQTDLIDDHNYTLFTEDYRIALKTIDEKIDQLNISIQEESNRSRKASLTDKKKNLLQKRSELLDEAEILEDLNKFY